MEKKQAETHRGNDSSKSGVGAEVETPTGEEAVVTEDSSETEATTAESGETGAGEEEGGSQDLAKQLEEAQKEIASLKESWTRERAEFVNFKKRTLQNSERNRVNVMAGFIENLLPVIDHLENVMKIKTENQEVINFVQGVDMIHKEFLSVLQKSGTKVVSAQGVEFNPEFMEAIATEESRELDKDTVLEVFQEGFYLELEEGQKRIIRPARVKVGKAIGSEKSSEE